MLHSILSCKSDNSYSFEVYETISKVDKIVWDNLNQKNNIYLSSSYLQALEDGMQDEIEFRYLLFYNREKQAVGASIFQIVNFRAKQLLQERIPCTIADKIQNYYLNAKDLSLLICGNLFACGENGFMINEKITKGKFLEVLSDAMSETQHSKINGSKISFSLLKEFWLSSDKYFNTLDRQSFLNFNIDVNMILKLRPDWVNFESYLEAMNSKYRTRAKAVIKKSSKIIHRNLTIEEIEQYLSIIKDLYHQVLGKADYNLGVLKVETFIELKKTLRENFMITGYFLENKLVGFTSSFLYDSIIDANFVGIDYNISNTYKLYQRMLYDYVKLGIDHKKQELRFGRTAETSKSEIGALPVEMKLFAKHRNSLPSQLLKPLISSIQPDTFELRKPFKN